MDIPWHGHGMYVRQCILSRADYVGKCGNFFPLFFFRVKFPPLVKLSIVIFKKSIVKVLIIKLRSANTAETRQYKTATKALLVLIPLLGISYIMLLHGPEDEVGGQMITILQAIFIPTQVRYADKECTVAFLSSSTQSIYI